MPSKWIYVLMLVVISINVVNAQEERLCHETFYFIVDHLDSENSLQYEQSEIGNLSVELNFTVIEIEKYISNYSDICKKFTQLPVKTYNIPTINNDVTQENCDYIVNGSFLILSMEDYFPINANGIVVGNVSCETIDTWKYFFKYQKSDDLNYKIRGIKLWWTFVVFFIVGITITFKITHSTLTGERLFKQRINQKI